MANLLPLIRLHAVDGNGAPYAGALLYTYEAGTSTPLAVYTDSTLGTAHANPVVADANGRFAAVWMAASNYKFILKTAAGVTIWTEDNVSGTFDVTGNDYKPSQQSTPDMTVLVAAGSFWDAPTGAIVSNAAQTSSLITAPVTNPRIDTIHMNRRTGVIGVTTGSEAGSPTAPTLAAGLLPVANVTLATTTTEIIDSLITDVRELEQLGLATSVLVDTGADAGEIAVNEQDWTALASAATVNIGAAATERVNITGTTTITAFDTVTAGLPREVRFDGILTLTHNATTLILLGGASITTAAGDIASFVSEGSGNWRCTKYQTASGAPVGSPTAAQGASDVLLATYAPSAAASVDITSVIDSTYPRYRIEIDNTVPSVDGASIWMRTSSNNGSAWDSSASNYAYQNAFVTGSLAATEGSNAATKIVLSGAGANVAVGNAAGEGFSGTVNIHDPSSASHYTRATWTAGWASETATPSDVTCNGSGSRRAAAAVNAVQVLPSSGTITGKVRIYGIKGA